MQDRHGWWSGPRPDRMGCSTVQSFTYVSPVVSSAEVRALVGRMGVSEASKGNGWQTQMRWRTLNPQISVSEEIGLSMQKRKTSQRLPSPGFLVCSLASFHSWSFSILCWILYVNIPAEAPGDVFSHLSSYPSPRWKKKPSVRRLSSVKAGLAFGWDTGCPCVWGLAPGASSWASGGSLCLQPPKAGG